MVLSDQEISACEARVAKNNTELAAPADISLDLQKKFETMSANTLQADTEQGTHPAFAKKRQAVQQERTAEYVHTSIENLRGHASEMLTQAINIVGDYTDPRDVVNMLLDTNTLLTLTQDVDSQHH